jgi:hypothetical protein
MADSDALAVVEHPGEKLPAHGTCESFCVRAWQHMRLEAAGEVRVCCIYQGDFVMQDGVPVSTDRQSLMEIWNADTMREVRRGMVEGRPVAGCEPCYNAEARGGQSIRQFDNRNWERGWLGEPKATIDEMMAFAADNDFRVPKLPELIDFQAASRCNLKCRMCNSAYSSRIAKDAVHRSWEPEEYRPRQDPTGKWLGSIENLVNELANDTGSEVRRLSFAGGEPLLMREIPRLLERLIATGRARFLSVQFISNGTVVPRWLSLAAQFCRFDLLISVDGHADHYEYIRYPGKWSKLSHHFELFKNIPNVYPHVTTTIQVNNVLRLADLFRYLDSIGINFTGYLLHGPPQLAVSILPSSVRHVAAARLREYAEVDCRPHQRALVLSFAAQIETGDAAGNPDLLRDFMLFTNDLDASRGQSIHRTDPELVELLEKEGFPWVHDTLHAPAASVSEETRKWRRALTETQNATLKLRRALDAAVQMLPDESAGSGDVLQLGETQAARYRDELADARLQLAEAYASRSWRLTRPLRAVGRRLRPWLRGVRSPAKPDPR